jgi:hypothetical protein
MAVGDSLQPSSGSVRMRHPILCVASVAARATHCWVMSYAESAVWDHSSQFVAVRRRVSRVSSRRLSSLVFRLVAACDPFKKLLVLSGHQLRVPAFGLGLGKGAVLGLKPRIIPKALDRGDPWLCFARCRHGRAARSQQRVRQRENEAGATGFWIFDFGLLSGGLGPRGQRGRGIGVPN